MSRITTTCDVCGWSETIPVGLVGDAAETVTALWNRHDVEHPTCSANTGTVSLETDLSGDQ